MDEPTSEADQDDEDVHRLLTQADEAWRRNDRKLAEVLLNEAYALVVRLQQP